MINSLAFKVIFSILIMMFSGFSVYMWHYKPIKELTSRILDQERDILNYKTEIHIFTQKIKNKTFEIDQINKKSSIKEKLYENNTEINTSTGTHIISI